MAKTAYFTICAKNYLAYALTLGRSLKAADPAATLFIVLADEASGDELTADIEFQILEARSLGLPTFDDMVTRYSVMEFSTAIKARAFRRLFRDFGFDRVIYLDPDILVLRPLTDIEHALENGAELVLTPHSSAPLDDGGDPDDLRIMRTGVYNLGFAAFARSRGVDRFLKWWETHLESDCRVALNEGLFVDQKFMDLAPAYLDRVHILRHPGYNTAYWNLMHRPVVRREAGWFAGGAPLHFFHFSGVVPGDPTVFSKHQDRFTPDDIGDLRFLLDEYLAALDRNGHERWRNYPYTYNSMPDGQPLTDLMRAVYRRIHPTAVRGAPDLAGLIEACNQPTSRIPEGPGPMVTRLSYEIWQGRDDLRKTFDLTLAHDRNRYGEWLMTSGVREHGLDERFLGHLAGFGSAAAAPRASLASGGGVASRLARWLLSRLDWFRPVYTKLPESWRAGARDLVVAAASGRVGLRAPTLRREDLDESVAVFGYFRTESGVGEGARQAWRALKAVDHPVHAHLVLASEVFTESLKFEAPLRTERSTSRTHLFHINADQIVNQQNQMPPDVFHPARFRVGFWAWELERFPDAWAPAFDTVDEIWTPSTFVRDSVVAATSKPVVMMPHAVSVPEAPIDGVAGLRRRFNLPQDAYLFLCAFDLNSFAIRKNPTGAVNAFRRAFSGGTSGARLVVKLHGGLLRDRDRRGLLAEINEDPFIHIIDDVLSSEGMSQLQWACDAFVALHRAEGFGLMIAEAMARGKPVIATNYSGNTDYFDAECGYPVGYRLTPVPPRAYPFGEGQHWAEPDLEEAAAVMRRLADDPRAGQEIGARAQVRIASSLSYTACGERMVARLKDVGAI